MTRPFESWLPQIGVIAIAGICKNAGKTTLLNETLKLYPEYRWAVFSTGIDGEDRDTVFDHAKPKVRLPHGSLFVCDINTVNRHGSDLAVIEKLPRPTRPLWIARAMTDLETEITGPSTVKEQVHLISMLTRLGVDKVLVDGSLDRMAISQSHLVEAVILAVGASFGTMEEILEELERIELLSGIHQATTVFRTGAITTTTPDTILLKAKKGWVDTGIASVIGHEKQIIELLTPEVPGIMIPGALTSSSFKLLRSAFAGLRKGLVISHPVVLKLDLNELKQLLATCPVQCQKSFQVKSIALNSWAAGAKPQDALEFREKIRGRFPSRELIDTMEVK